MKVNFGAGSDGAIINDAGFSSSECYLPWCVRAREPRAGVISGMVGDQKDQLADNRVWFTYMASYLAYAGSAVLGMQDILESSLSLFSLPSGTSFGRNVEPSILPHY